MKLGVVSDLHWTATPDPSLAWHGPFDVPGVLGRLAEALAWFARERVDAVVVAGDLTDGGDAGALDAVLGALARGWDGRAFVVAGNHDVLPRADALAGALVRRRSSAIALARPAGEHVGGMRLAGVAPGELPVLDAWGAEPVVLISHHPLLSRADAFAARGLRYAGDLRASLATGELLAARAAPTVVVGGHLHARDHHRRGTLLQLTVGALVEPPFEATMLDVSVVDDAVAVRREARAIGRAADAPGPALTAAVETLTVSGGAPCAYAS